MCFRLVLPSPPVSTAAQRPHGCLLFQHLSNKCWYWVFSSLSARFRCYLYFTFIARSFTSVANSVLALATHAADAFRARRDKEKQRKASPSSGGWDLHRSENVGSVLQLGLLELSAVISDPQSWIREFSSSEAASQEKLFSRTVPNPRSMGWYWCVGHLVADRTERINTFTLFCLLFQAEWCFILKNFRFLFITYGSLLTGCLLSYSENTTYHILLLHLSTTP